MFWLLYSEVLCVHLPKTSAQYGTDCCFFFQLLQYYNSQTLNLSGPGRLLAH